MLKAHPKLKSNCENCGSKDDLEYYEFVLNGITLCGDCADLTPKNICKNNASINWVKVDGELYPSNLPIVKRHEESNG